MRRFSVFTLISGTGWLIDLGLTVALVIAGAGPFLASVIGSLTAVTFVFAISQLMVFDTGGRIQTRHYGRYLVWHAVTIPLASGAVAGLTGLFEGPVGYLADALPKMADLLPGVTALSAGAAKAAITPVTLTANFFFMRWLVERRGV